MKQKSKPGLEDYISKINNLEAYFKAVEFNRSYIRCNKKVYCGQKIIYQKINNFVVYIQTIEFNSNYIDEQYKLHKMWLL